MGNQDGHGHRHTARTDGYDDAGFRLPSHAPPVEAQREFVRQIAAKHPDGDELVAMLLGDDQDATVYRLDRTPAKPRRRWASGKARKIRTADIGEQGREAA